MPVPKIILCLLSLFLLSCETRNSNEKLDTYIDHPLDGDTSCINDIKRAKEDIKNGKIVFFAPNGLFSTPFRQEKYARQLCALQHLTFEFYHFSDVIVDLQTNNCYEAFMDRCIAQKFGASFKDRLNEEADSMLLASHDTLWNYLCEIKPKLINKPERENLYIRTGSLLKNKLQADKDGDLPYMDVRYIIDVTGKVPNYYLIEQLYNFGPKQNEQFKPDMLEAAVKELSHFNTGIPGEIKGKKFATFNTIRVVFK